MWDNWPGLNLTPIGWLKYWAFALISTSLGALWDVIVKHRLVSPKIWKWHHTRCCPDVKLGKYGCSELQICISLYDALAGVYSNSPHHSTSAHRLFQRRLGQLL